MLGFKLKLRYHIEFLLHGDGPCVLRCKWIRCNSGQAHSLRGSGTGVSFHICEHANAKRTVIKPNVHCSHVATADPLGVHSCRGLDDFRDSFPHALRGVLRCSACHCRIYKNKKRSRPRSEIKPSASSCKRKESNVSETWTSDHSHHNQAAQQNKLPATREICSRNRGLLGGGWWSSGSLSYQKQQWLQHHGRQHESQWRRWQQCR